jgi:hypothetical protein
MTKKKQKKVSKKPLIDTDAVVFKAMSDIFTSAMNSIGPYQYPKMNYLYPNFPQGAHPKMIYKPLHERQQPKGKIYFFFQFEKI